MTSIATGNEIETGTGTAIEIEIAETTGTERKAGKDDTMTIIGGLIGTDRIDTGKTDIAIAIVNARTAINMIGSETTEAIANGIVVEVEAAIAGERVVHGHEIVSGIDHALAREALTPRIVNVVEGTCRLR